MKRLALLLALTLLVPAAAATADPVAVGDTVRIADGPGTYSNGGAFWIQKAGANLFFSFCIERDEYINFSNPFTVTRIDTIAYGGGLNTNSGDPLDPKTAYLYTRFRNTYAGGAGLTDAIASSYQRAIWFIEEETKLGEDLLADAMAQTLYNDALGAGWKGLGDVRVLAFDGRTGGTQDLLVLVPEPGSMVLLGTGLLGAAGAIRRRLRRK